MTEPPPVSQLTVDLDHWEITLQTGEVVNVRAHAFGAKGQDLVFVAVMEGDPPYEYEILRLPSAIVKDVEGGWAAPRDATP